MKIRVQIDLSNLKFLLSSFSFNLLKVKKFYIFFSEFTNNHFSLLIINQLEAIKSLKVFQNMIQFLYFNLECFLLKFENSFLDLGYCDAGVILQ